MNRRGAERARPLAIVATLVPLLGLAQGCDRAESKAQAKGAQSKDDPVVYYSKPVVEEVTDSELFTGRTEAEKTVEIRARVTGYLQKILFEDGAEVPADSPLFEIDARPYKAVLERAEATVAQMKARHKRAEADYSRKTALFNRGTISREEYDIAVDEYYESKAAVGVAEADVDSAKLNMTFTTVTTPVGGRISRRMVDVGNLVRADDTLLTTVVAIDRLYVYFDVDERTLLKLRRLVREGRIQSRTQGAEIPIFAALADEDEFTHRGTINFSDNRVDPNTATLQVRAVIDNPRPHSLSPGLFVRVRLPVGKPYDALMVPELAVGTDQGRKFLYVIDEKDEVVYRPVKVGPQSGDKRVIEEGLKPGERVVVNGLQRIRPGKKVVAKPAEELAERDRPDGPGGADKAVAEGKARTAGG